ncbi:MIP family channel protein [Nocardioides alcanivorans]|uniref:MIP family channel protein n=1 Tax=Nocardioides alcanivorans TaxID=2897352 RepID=UPI001F180EB5|nr:MIP family channel protein [Nocardioides alcanivorans]
MTAESLDPPALPRKLAAEVLGTFVLVFLGCGAAMSSGAAGGSAPNLVGTALAFGIAVLVMAYAVGHISGGHFNPAVSVGAAIAGRFAWIDVAYYVVAQLVGALLAGVVLFTVFKGIDGFEAEGNMAQNSFGDDGSGLALWAALIIEIIGTAVFLWVILAATDKRNKTITGAAPVAIGLTLTALHLVMIPLTGTSVNPARSIGVGVFAGTDAIVQLWLFIVAPLLGAAIAGFSYMFIFGRDGMSVPGAGLQFASAPRQQQWDSSRVRASGRRSSPNSSTPTRPDSPDSGELNRSRVSLGRTGVPSRHPGQQPPAPWGQRAPPAFAGPARSPSGPPPQSGPPSGAPQQGGQPPQPPAPPAQGGWTPPSDQSGTQVRPPEDQG